MTKIKYVFIFLCTILFGSVNGQYCMSGGPSSTADSHTERVILNGLSGSINYTGCPPQTGIEDYTSTQSVTLSTNAGYIISCKFGTCDGNYSNRAEVWIDFNGNQSFEPNESILQWQGTPPMSLQDYNFIVPSNAIIGTTRMRVMQHEGASSFPLDPCASFTWGSVLDFSVVIQQGNSCFTVNSYPYTQSFENNLSGWVQDNADSIDWSFNSGSTPSQSTGPSSASDGNEYIYIEASAPNYPAKTANLLSPCFDLTPLDNPSLTFAYHMYGADMGTLDLEISIGGANWSNIWSISGNQGNSWIPFYLDLSPYTNETDVRFRFNGTTGTDYTSDICIDAIGISCAGSLGDNSPTPIPVISYPYTDSNSTLNCFTNHSLVYESPDVFYLAVLDPSKDSLRASLCGSDFDTYLTIQNTNGDVIFYNDDFTSCSPQSEILFPTLGLDSVYIVVEGWGTDAGAYVLNIDNNYVNITSVKDLNSNKGYRPQLYPNPTSDIIHIKGIYPEQVLLYSINGKLLRSISIKTNSVDLSSLSSGMYIINLIYDGQLWREKVIKK
ncbi:MAG: GEVED domain-containing protein [Saprospiraceae bacterium]|nr:GEVED domain-containing protein [Saprospiraceae bacterium]